MENIIKRQPVRCYAYLAIMLITGVLLIWSRGWGWTDWALITKLGAFALLTGSLSYVHFKIQPNVERILAGCKPGEELDASKRPLLVSWRTRRKRLSAVCLFLVLTSLIMGVRLTLGYAPWLVAVFTVLALLFAWRAYKKPVRLGWI
jgi:fatty acid desaturase